MYIPYSVYALILCKNNDYKKQLVFVKYEVKVYFL